MQFWVNVVDQALITAVFAVALNVVLGTAGQLWIATVALGGIGGFTAAYLSVHHGLALFPLLLIGIAVSFIAGVALGLPALRLTEEGVILLTIAFTTVVIATIDALPSLGGGNGIIGIRFVNIGGTLLLPTDWLPLLAGMAVVCCSMAWRLTASPYGRVLRGIREDADATEAVGKNVIAYKLAIFGWTSAMAGAAAVMLVHYNQVAVPTNYDFNATTVVAAAVVVGGIGSLPGAIVGAFVLQFVGPVLQRVVNLSPDKAALWQLVIYGSLLVIVMRVRPEGIVPEGSSLGWLRRTRAATLSGPPPDQELAAHGVTAHAPSVPVHVAQRDEVPPEPAGADAVVATGLRKRFGGITAVWDLEFALPRSHVTALVGPNGAGKTTVFNLVTGRIRPDAGRVVVHGRDVTGMRPYEVARAGMARSFQDVRTLTRMSLLDNVALGVPGQPGEHIASLFLRPRAVHAGVREARERAMECLRFVGLEHRAAETAGLLGYGDQKLLSVARLLATGADVLLIDEPAAGIDRGNLEPVLEVVERLRDEGKTVCLVEHNLDVVARLADHVLFVEQGQITTQGTMEEITRDPRLADVYFGHV